MSKWTFAGVQNVFWMLYENQSNLQRDGMST